MPYVQLGRTQGLGQAEHSRALLARDLAAGAITGELAGVVMMTVLVVAFPLAMGRSPLVPLQVIGAFVFGDTATEAAHLPSLVAAVVLHLMGPSLLWGLVAGALVFALNVRRFPSLLPLGLMVGVLAQVVDVNMVLPPAFQALHGHNIWAENIPTFWSWVAHVVYGLTLTLHAVVFRRLGAYLD
ncbi:MAG: hypothetical protein AB2A00_04955 [Myxococcota bacterium]